MLEPSDEWECARPTKVAKCACAIPLLFHETNQCPRTTLLSKPSGTGEAAVNKPHSLANVRHHSPMVNMVIEDFDYRRVESKTESEDEDVEDNLEYPSDLPVSLVSPFSYLLNCH